MKPASVPREHFTSDTASLIRLANHAEPAGAHVVSLDAGTLISHFELRRRLGSGGGGIVYEAHDLALERTVAVKIMRNDAGDSEARERSLREARALAQLRHPNVVSVYEYGVAEPNSFIAMELMRGTTLRHWLRLPRTWQQVVDMFVAVGAGLAAMHAVGLIHRDIKPANIFLDGWAPKLGDFGLATRVPEGAETKTKNPWRPLSSDDGIVGTPGYIAPELLLGSRADARSDQYSFCASLYEALTGDVPGKRAPLSVPRELRAILLRGLSTAPELRYPSIAALLDALRAARDTKRLAAARKLWHAIFEPA